MPQVLLSIGGSDSGGGAGIQADLKTFSILGWHGTCAVTAITAQNTIGVQRIFGLEPAAVAAQLESITDDFSVAFAKTGMLYSGETVTVVAEHLSREGIPFVLDPVIEAEAGGRLLRPDAVAAVKEHLIPLSRVVTPNIFEAEAITGVRVNDAASAELAAGKILELGAEAAVVKGGHLDCTDILREEGHMHRLPGRRVAGGNHGVGCTYSAALTAFLAQGRSLREAALLAKTFAAGAISRSMPVGRGAGPVNQSGLLREEAERFRVLCDLQEAADLVLGEPEIRRLIPDEGSYLGMAIERAASLKDVASVESGTVLFGRVHQCGCAKFGADDPLVRTILAAMRFDPAARAAMNLSMESVESCKALGLVVACLDRDRMASNDGFIIHCLEEAIKVRGYLPDAILAKGGESTRPVMTLLGPGAAEVAAMAARIAGHLQDGKI